MTIPGDDRTEIEGSRKPRFPFEERLADGRLLQENIRVGSEGIAGCSILADQAGLA